MPKIIYFDNAATTPVDERVLREMSKYFNKSYGNASSQHQLGQEARRAVEESRAAIARAIGAKPREIIFTSGGTESNNFALKGLADAYPDKRHAITTKIDHDCVLNTCRWLEKKGMKITYLDVDKDGFVNPEDVRNAITTDTLFVSIIHGNNEIGTIQDLSAIGDICREKKVYFHTDACQSFTKVPLNVNRMKLDLVTLNAHKIHGPKGIGALYIKEGVKLTPLLHGGGHEFRMRSGTENVPGIVGFAKAVASIKSKDIKKMMKLRDKIIEGISAIPNTKLNGPIGERRLCNNVNVSFNDIEGESIGAYLDAKGICTSTGSACSSHTLETSHVLRAIGLKPEQAQSSLRISLGKFNTEKEVDYFLEILPKIVEKLRRISKLF